MSQRYTSSRTDNPSLLTGRFEMRALASLLCLITTMVVGLPLANGEESEHRTRPASTKNVVAQKGEEGLSQGPSPAKDVPLGGMTVEDLLLQKGAITMD